MPNLLDSILTLIERREAEQIQYGLYDITLTGGDVLDAFPRTQEAGVRRALTDLWQRGLIIRFDADPDHRDWQFRSRTSETVRLLSKLRQRIVRNVREQRIHRAERSPRLVHDLKFEVLPRQVPNRHLRMSTLTATLLQRGGDECQAGD